MPADRRAIDPFAILDAYTDIEKYEAPEADKELVKTLHKRFEQAHDAKRYYERDWEVNRAYLKGDVVARHRDTGEIVRLATEDSKRLRSRNNVLRPTARSLVGKLAKMIPTCTVVPATADFAEQHGARVGDAILQYLRRKEDLDTKYLDLMSYLPWAGNSFVQLMWDPNGGAKLAFCNVCDYFTYDIEKIETPCPQCVSQKETEFQLQELKQNTAHAEAATQAVSQVLPGMEEHALAQVQPPQIPLEQKGPLALEQEVPSLVEAYEGDVRLLVVDPRDVYTPPGCTELKHASWICKRDVVEVSAARKRFPLFANFIHKEDGLFSDKTAKWRYNILDTAGAVDWLTDHVWVYEFHERPTEVYPNGRVICMVNDMIVEESPSPYQCLDRLPFYKFGFDTNNGEFWCEPFITQAWHRQRELDHIETKIREHIELLLAQKILVPNGSQIATDEITAQTAQVIKYNAAAGNPKPLDIPQLPQQAWQRKADIIADIRMGAGITEQEAGLTTSDPNGRAMAIINAEADQQIGPIVTRNHAEWRDMHKGMLVLVQKKYHPQRKVTVAGPEGVQTFSFDELVLNPGYDVHVEESDGLSRNPAIRFNEVLQLATVMGGSLFMNMSSGTPMPDPKKFARMAKLKLPEQGYDTEATERAAAQQIPYLMSKGLQYQPEPFDDPRIFSEELLGWLRGPGRQSAPELRQQVMQVWMYYVQWTQSGQMGPMPGMGQGPSQPGQMSAPGGTPNNPGQLGTDLAPGNQGLGQQANNQVAQADQVGDRLAQGMSHES